MDFVAGNSGNSGDEQEHSCSRKGKKTFHRHTAYQIQSLETFFKDFPHPDENQRRQLSRELGLDPKQIKFWFQNKRTQTKAQNERADNSILRAENERIQCENLAIREALKNVICPACGGPPFGEEERQRSLQKLQLENAQLKEEHEKVSNLLARYIGKPISQINSLMSVPIPAPTSESVVDHPVPVPPVFPIQDMDLDLNSSGNLENIPLAFHLNGISDVDKALMMDTANNAMDELIRLLQINEPLWIKSSSDGRYTIHRDSYEKIFPRVSHFKTSTSRLESSKCSGMVTMNAMQLVDMFLDSEKWADIFPTIVSKAKTIQVLESGIIGNRNAHLQLMHEQMHILSPLVPPREYYFLRHCQQIELGLWVIVDVSYDWPRENIASSRCWRLPSGCMIQEMTNSCSNVTWVEHVEVDDKTLTHRLYRDLICGSSAYGAERWVLTLQRMCERLAFAMPENSRAHHHEFAGVINLPEGRKSMLKLARRMVKNFCAMLSMSGKLDFPQLSEVNNSGVRVSVRKSIEPGQPSGMIVSAATSLWLPLPSENVFNFFKDEKMRVQWDVLSNGNPVNEIARISTGAHPGNCISIIRPFIPTESNMVMLQESCIDILGSMVVYAPIDIPSMNLAISGEDSSTIAILPSGFVISGDGRQRDIHGASTSTNTASVGSLLTVAFQILVSSPASSKDFNMESVATVNTLISSTVQRIKATLNCSNLD
ncbi:Homeobox-leucine zipper protein [Melia azedarach]|uniref:Homeobox-leucine zipper protein n=1 Tax=Melia azedarach TaxID=155640 RepID=A0ACC1X618_MELAZ|nr:Homeobox-leucine zipper protein [Melia azedarach]